MLVIVLFGCDGVSVGVGPTSPAPDLEARPVQLDPPPAWACSAIVEGATDQFPIGAAVASSPRTGQVFFAWDRLDKQAGLPQDQAFLAAYQCTGAGCATATLLDGPLPVGAPIGWGNSLQPSLALHAEAGIPELRLLLRQKIEPDCDSDGATSEDGDRDDQAALDLEAYAYDRVHGLGAGNAVAVNAGQCVDRGVNRLRFGGGAAHACFTEKVPGADDAVACAVEDGAHWTPEAGPTNDGGGDEDHPSLAMVRGRRVVAGHQMSRNGSDAVRVHLVDQASPPNEPVVAFPSGPTDTVNHPDLESGGGKLRLVYQDGESAAAAIWYSECDSSTTCASPGDWTVPEPVADATTGLAEWASLPQIAVDGDRQWVVFVHDADPAIGGVAARVVAATRCGDDPWTLTEVRAPEVDTEDQSLEFGRPSLVLDPEHRTAHLVFAEFDDYIHREDLAARTRVGDLFWCAQRYDPCPD